MVTLKDVRLELLSSRNYSKIAKYTQNKKEKTLRRNKESGENKNCVQDCTFSMAVMSSTQPSKAEQGYHSGIL